MSSRFDFFYLIEIQYLGFRYHGWQVQDGLKTIQGMLDRTFNFVFEDKKFRVLGAGRTDSMVSAESGYFELFTKHKLDIDIVKKNLNFNLPPDINVLNIIPTDNKFNIIQDVRLKTYHYYFAVVTEKYPFASPFMSCFEDEIDILRMQKGAKLFEGEHDFQYYTKADSANKNTIRKINECRIVENTELTASFFPKESFVLIVTAKGFMRYQIRMMMGALIRLGRNEISFEDIQNSLLGRHCDFLKLNAPASGLRVKNVQFK